MDYKKALLVTVILLATGYAATYLVLYNQASNLADYKAWRTLDDYVYKNNGGYEYVVVVEIPNETPLMFEISSQLDCYKESGEPRYMGQFHVLEQVKTSTGYTLKLKLDAADWLSQLNPHEEYEKANLSGIIDYDFFLEKYLETLYETPGIVKGNINIRTSILFIPFEYTYYIETG